MQVPLAVFAVDPGRRVVFPCDEVVAPRLVAVPPARFDALGTGEQRGRLLPEPARRLEQPQRSPPRLAELARLPLARLDRAPGELGTVIGMQGEAVHRASAEALLQPL